MSKLIVGNSLGCLVSALEISKKDKVTLLMPNLFLGSYFQGFKTNDYCFDNGTILYEFTTFNEISNNLLDYDNSKRYDVGRYATHPKTYLENLGIEFVQMPNPQIWLNGKQSDDILMINKFDALNILSKEDQESIKNELDEILNQHAQGNKRFHHASNKNHILYDQFSLKDASELNHGKLFHKIFLENFINKCFNETSQSFISPYHRVCWLPIYWPETLRSQFTDNPQVFKNETYCHYPKYGNTRFIIDTIFSKIKNNKNIKIEIDDLCSMKKSNNLYEFQGKKGNYSGDFIVWGLENNVLLNFMGFENDVVLDKTHVCINYLAVKTADVSNKFSTLFIPDNNLIPYRITNQSFCSHSNDHHSLITVETNVDYLNKIMPEHDDYKNHIENILIELGIIKNKDSIFFHEQKTTRNGRVLPSYKNEYLFNLKYKFLNENLKNFYFIGPSSGFTTSSFNDQIVQGLHLGEKF